MRVYETFYSFQGEGSMVGVRTAFVRTAGCNLDCSFCDTDWKVKGSEFSLDWLPNETVEWIWLTGGEPLIQDVTPYVNKWRGAGFKVAVETNGTFSLPCEFDHVTMSPKVKSDQLKLLKCDDLKVVVPAYDPLSYDLVVANNRFVQPEWGSELVKITVPKGWRLSMQNHKYWGVR